ncbi:MAG TPA: sulfatase-like hydrolase/transferase [Fimbriimonas sp.]
MLSLFAASILTASATTATIRPPNVVLIVADDLGYGDASTYGGWVPTPNLDDLAASGIRMTDGYVVCPMCAPSRAGLMTSYYPQRFGFEFNPERVDTTDTGLYGLPPDRKTLAERMREIGYSTALFGKWHLGDSAGLRPLDRGFDRFYGFHGGASGHLPKNGVGIKLFDDRTPIRIMDYLPEALTREAVSYINHSASRPFFVCLSYDMVHLPYESTPKYLDRFPNLTGVEQVYSAMVSALDDGVGAVRQAVRDNGLERDTLFVFMSDNGGGTANGPASNYPLRGGKNTHYEGGIRVPMIYSWPGRLPEGVTYSRPVSALDIGPTAMAAAMRPIRSSERIDGVNLMPYLTGSKTFAPHAALYWRMGEERAIRKGNDKYLATVHNPLRTWTETYYRLGSYRDEYRDLSLKFPDRLNTLRDEWSVWSSQLMDPLWTR